MEKKKFKGEKFYKIIEDPLKNIAAPNFMPEIFLDLVAYPQ